MTGGIVLAVVALVAGAVLAHIQRSLAERSVDALYLCAALIYAAAQAADAALVRYRVVRQEFRKKHVPMYAEGAGAG